MESLQERVIATIAKAVPMDREAITPDSTFDELGIESLDVVNIVFELEIPDEFNLSELGNIGDVETAVAGFLADRGGDVRQ